MADKFTTARTDSALPLGATAVIHSPADEDLPINVKAVVFDADGTIDFKNSADEALIAGFTVRAGIPLPFVPCRITAMSGPAVCFLIM